MTHSRGISGDIARPVRRPPLERTRKPLPAGMPARMHQVPAAPPASTQAAPVASPDRHSKPRTKPRPRSRAKTWELLQYPLIAGLALVAAANSTFGQIVIGLYAVYVIVLRRRPATLTFGLALLILVSIPVFSLIGQPDIADNAAIYVYELLVVGTIQAILELRHTD